jgi:hypothetical protein
MPRSRGWKGTRMKSIRSMVRCALGAACVVGIAAGEAGAQTCGSPLTMAPDSIVETTSCSGQPFAGGGVSGPGAVLDFTLDHPSSVTFGVAANLFSPSVCVVNAGECATDTCLATGEAGAPVTLDALPEGSYWVIVTASPFDAPGACGMFELVNDTQAADTILANGFD